MTSGLILRPVVALFAVASMSGCGMVEADPNRFESFASSVAAIDLDAQPVTAPAAAPAPRRSAAEAGLRPALRVEVMDPHALWDARDGLSGTVERAAPRLAAAAAPAVADAVVRQVTARVDGAAARAGLRPAMAHQARATPRAAAAGLVQIGAYSSETAARAAWSRLRTGPAAPALDGLLPVYENVEVDGRRLVRLKVAVPAARASAVCAAAGVNDPWCDRVA